MNSIYVMFQHHFSVCRNIIISFFIQTVHVHKNMQHTCIHTKYERVVIQVPSTCAQFFDVFVNERERENAIHVLHNASSFQLLRLMPTSHVGMHDS